MDLIRSSKRVDVPLSDVQQTDSTFIAIVIGATDVTTYSCCPLPKRRVVVDSDGLASGGKCRISILGSTTSYPVHFQVQGCDSSIQDFENTVQGPFSSVTIQEVHGKEVAHNIPTKDHC